MRNNEDIIKYYNIDSEINIGKILFIVFYPIFSILFIILIINYKKIKIYYKKPTFLIYFLLLLFIGSFVGTVIGLYNILKNTNYILSYNDNIIKGTYSLLLGYIVLLCLVLYLKHKKKEKEKEASSLYKENTIKVITEFFYTDTITISIGILTGALVIYGNVNIIYIPK
jgi:hypothetical protein